MMANLGIPAEKMIEPGIYFGMPEERYHATFALSGSGIRNLHVSPLDFWVRSPLNPNLSEVLDEEKSSDAQSLGTAYHKRILEGQEAFAKHYAPALDKADYEGVMFGADDLKAFLRAHNETVTDKGQRILLGGKKEDLIDRVLAINPSAPIWDVIEDGYRKTHEGKQLLSAKALHQIEIMAAMVERKPDLRGTFTGGVPEVSVFYECQHTGIPCKFRVDYLKLKQVVELKGFQNQQRRPVEEAIYRAFANNRYARSAAWYMDGMSYVPALVKAGRVFGDHDPAFVRALAQPRKIEFKFVFIQKGVAPVARGMTFGSELDTFAIAKAKNDSAKQTLRECLEAYPPGSPWVDAVPTHAFTDEEMPTYAAD